METINQIFYKKTHRISRGQQILKMEPGSRKSVPGNKCPERFPKRVPGTVARNGSPEKFPAGSRKGLPGLGRPFLKGHALFPKMPFN